jgi:hypothetical protein
MLLTNVTVMSAMLVTSFALTSCGRPKQVAAATSPAGEKTEDDGFTEAVPCTKKECPPASMDASSPGFATSGQLIGFVNEQVPWEFTGVDINDPTREVGILLDDVPSGSKVSPDSGGREVHTIVKIEWTPTSAVMSSKPLKIIVRDLERCLVKEAKEATCHSNKMLKSYDDEIPVNWEIVDRAAAEAAAQEAQNAVGQAQCDAAKAAQKNAMTGQMVTGGMSVLLNPAAASSVLANLGGKLIMDQIAKPTIPGCP